MYLHDIGPFGKGGRGRRNSVFKNFKHSRTLAERLFQYGRPCTFEPIEYWQTVNIFNPCRYCGKTSECNYSKDNSYLVCNNVRGDVEVPGGGFLHVLKNSIPPPLEVPPCGRSWLDIPLEQTEPDVMAEDPLGDSEALLESMVDTTEYCGTLSLVFDRLAAEKLKLEPTYCNNKAFCPRCGGEWSRQVGSYYSQMWAQYPRLHFRVAEGITRKSANALLQRVETVLARMPDKPQHLASIGPKFLVVITEAALDGSYEISPRQALGLLAYLALRPGSRTKLSTSNHGSWQWPKEAMAGVIRSESFKFFGDEAMLLAAKSAIHKHFGEALSTVSSDQVYNFIIQWCRSEGWYTEAVPMLQDD